MKTFTVYPEYGTPYTISAMSLEDIFLLHYSRLMKSGRMSGKEQAGYLKKVTWRYDPMILDGQGGVQGIMEWQVFHVGRLFEDQVLVTTVEIAARSEEFPTAFSYTPVNVKRIVNTTINYVEMEVGQLLLASPPDEADEKLQAAYRQQEAGEKSFFLVHAPAFPALFAIYMPQKGMLVIGGASDKIQQALVPDLETGLIWYFDERTAWEKARQF